MPEASPSSTIAIVSSNGIYQCVGEKLHLQFDARKVVGRTLLVDQADTLGIGAMEKGMITQLKAAIQQFNSHMGSGQLVVER